jgi:hypothetical protein
MVLLSVLAFWAGSQWRKSKSEDNQDYRSIFAAHYALVLKPEMDRAPKTFVLINCLTCGAQVECPIRIVLSWSGGKQKARVDLDPTDLEAHELSHA